MTKTHLVKINDDPISWGYGKEDALVNAGEAWEGVVEGDHVEVWSFDNGEGEKFLGVAKVAGPVKANILGVDFEPNPGSTFRVAEIREDGRLFYWFGQGGFGAGSTASRKFRAPSVWKRLSSAREKAQRLANYLANTGSQVAVIESFKDGGERLRYFKSEPARA